MELENTKTTAPLTALFASGLALFIYYLSATTMPLLQFFLYFPFTTLLLTEELRWSGLSFLITATGMGIFFGVDPVLRVMPKVILFSLVLARLIRSESPRFAEWVISALLFVGIHAGLLFLLGSGTDMLQSLSKVIQENVDSILETLRLQGVEMAKVTAMEPLLRRSGEAILRALPALFFLEGLFSAMVTTGMTRWMVTKSTVDPLERVQIQGKFSDYRINRKISLGMVLLILLGLVLDGRGFYAFPPGRNLLVAMMALYMVNGYAHLDGKLEKQGVRRWARALLVCLSFFFAFLALFFTFLGFVWSFLQRRTAFEGGSHER